MIDGSFYQLLIEDIPERAVETVYIFHHTVLIKTACSVGVSSIAGKGICSPPKDFGKLQYKNLRELAQYYLSDNYLEVAIGMAAINATFNREELFEDVQQEFNAHQLIHSMGKDKNVAIIGGFPFIERLKDELSVKNLWVFEFEKRYGYELLPQEYGQYLPRADLVLMTATTLVNKSFHHIYPHLDNSYNVIMGPTTPMNIKLFDYKINVLAGMIVKNYEDAFLSFSQGAASKYAEGVKKVVLLE